MSAERDPQQKTTFIYSNFYQLYRKEKLEEKLAQEFAPAPAPATPDKSHLITGVVLRPTNELFQKWTRFESGAKNELAQQVRSLRESRKRLAFLLTELDTILKRG